MTTPANKRNQIVAEIISTEEAYVKNLGIIIEVFLKPIRSKNLLPKDDLSPLFANVEYLVPINQDLLKDLKKSPPAEVEVGKAFLQRLSLFKRYAIYCSNQTDMVARLHKCKKDHPNFTTFLKECENNPSCRYLQLDDFLIEPMQRITRYPLLLKNLLDHTPEDNKDHTNLKETLNGIEHIVNLVNETTGKAQNVNKLKEIQASFGKEGNELDLIDADRRPIKEGAVKTRKGKKDTEVYLFLFDDLLLIAKSNNGNNYSLIRKIPIPNRKPSSKKEKADIVFLRDLTAPIPGVVPSSPNSEISFEILTTSQTLEKFIFATKEEKNAWYKAFQEATELTALAPSTPTSPNNKVLSNSGSFPTQPSVPMSPESQRKSFLLRSKSFMSGSNNQVEVGGGITSTNSSSSSKTPLTKSPSASPLTSRGSLPHPQSNSPASVRRATVSLSSTPAVAETSNGESNASGSDLAAQLEAEIKHRKKLEEDLEESKKSCANLEKRVKVLEGFHNTFVDSGFNTESRSEGSVTSEELNKVVQQLKEDQQNEVRELKEQNASLTKLVEELAKRVEELATQSRPPVTIGFSRGNKTEEANST